jgi:hypothetical protein
MGFSVARADPPAPMALGTPDRLAAPVMPESPTQVDVGRNLYYYHCMPCHGDQGQGLTDEWRQVWEEDHQNCWARGCHSGRAGEEGFPIPRLVPPVSGSTQTIAGLQTADGLFEYLRQTHPPQRPGALLEEEYWALVAFLLYENGRLGPDDQVGHGAAQRSALPIEILGGAALGLLLIVLLILWKRKRLPSRR